MAELTLFISHRSTDSLLAQALVHLFEKALKIPARQIRCTSVDGYRLPVGADSDEQLRREVFESRAFVGVVTPSSLKSAYVLFELGARWGARKHLAPVLARDADPSMLGGPLSGINSLQLRERPQVVQLVEDIAEYLDHPLEPAASYQAAIESVVAQARMAEPGSVAEQQIQRQEALQPEEIEIQILSIVAHAAKRPTQTDIALRTKLEVEKANYHLERLVAADLLESTESMYTDDVWYGILQTGREMLVTRGLL